MRRATIALVVLGALVVTAVWYFLFVSPKNSAIADAEQQLLAAQDEQRSLETTIAQLQAIKDSEISYIFAVGEMETSVPPTPNLDTFIEDLTFLADRSGVELSSITSSAPGAVGEGLFEITLGLNVTGEFFEVLGFLYGLEAMPRIVRVDGISLTPEAPVVEEPEEPDTGDTTTTTTTTVPVTEAADRPLNEQLIVTLSAKIFTRSGVVVAGTPVEDGTAGDGTTGDGTTGDGTTGDTTTTTTTEGGSG